MSEGLRSDDPGVLLLAGALRGVDPRTVLLVHGGDLPGLGPGATRLALDVREFAHSNARLVGIDDGPALAALFNMGHAVVWPRAHLGKDFSLACLARGALSLAPGGQLLCAVRKQKGADSLADFMALLLGNVEVRGRARGYRLLVSVRKGDVNETAAREALELRYVITDPALPGLELKSAPGVFSRRGLDDGTRALIEHVGDWAEAAAFVPDTVLDLCAGIGPLGLWAASKWAKCTVVAVESSLLAGMLLEDNARIAGFAGRVKVYKSDGLPERGSVGNEVRGAVNLVLVNPPTHADKDDLSRLLGGIAGWVAPGGHCFAVASRAGVTSTALARAGATVTATETGAYSILHGRW